MMHDFTQSLEREWGLTGAPTAELFYCEQVWPGQVERFEQVFDIGQQRRGVDRLVCLKDGQTLRVEEKYHLSEWLNLPLELVSNDKTGTPGWAVDPRKETDILVYFAVRRGWAVVIPYPRLREVALEWRDRLLTARALKSARNRGGYNTLFWPAPPWFFTDEGLGIGGEVYEMEWPASMLAELE